MTATAVRDWAGEQGRPGTLQSGQDVESLSIRDGMTLVLSRFEAGEPHGFKFTEPADVIGIAFHLKGGTQFDTPDGPLETASLDIWAGSAAAGSGSCFRLPRKGFHTISVRMSPAVACDLADSTQSWGLDLQQVGPPVMQHVGVMDRRSAELSSAMLHCDYVGAARRLFLESGALGLLAGQLARAEPSRAPRRCTRKRLEQAREHLEANLAEPPSIVALARMVGLNDFALKRDFKQAFGTTVFGYVRERRLERAAAELLDGLSVQEAAHSVGYDNPRCFADAFRRRYGVPPSRIGRRTLAEAPASYA